MSETLVTIGKYLDVTEAHIAAGLLQSEGIPVYPLDIDRLSTNPVPGVGFAGARLRVPANFAREARKLLVNRESTGGAQLNFLATGEASDPGEARDDHIAIGVLSICDWVKRKELWMFFLAFDLVFVALVFFLLLAT